MYEIDYNPKFVPIPSPKVNVKSTIVDGKPSFLMKNHATGIYYDLDELTNLIWNVTDGKKTVRDIVKEVQRQKPETKENSVIEILLFFAESNLLTSSLETKQKKRFRAVSPFEIDFTLIKDSHRFVKSLHTRIHPIFKGLLLWISVALIIACAVLFAGRFVSIYGQKSNFEILGSSVVGFFFYYFIALAPIIAIHEIAHAITLVHYGGRAGEMGTGLFYFSPMFYTETTDAWGLSRHDRMMVYLAGNISTLLIGSALFIAYLTVQIPGIGGQILLMIAFYCFSMSLMNFAPPFETDGYYLLSDIVNMPNLRRDSYGYLGSIFRRAFRRPVKKETMDLDRRKKRIYLVYALLSVAYIVYIVFQTSLFLFYMSQDVTAALANIGQAVLSSKVVSGTAVVVTAASTLYFGMQLTGYGFAFSAGVRKAIARPLTVEAIHDRDLAVFAYLPPQCPEMLSNNLKSKMEKIARKFTTDFELKQLGRSCLAILRMGGANLALVQIKEHLMRIEKEFNSAYEHLILRNRDSLYNSAGMLAPEKIRLTEAFQDIARESVDAGNSSAVAIAKACEEAQKEKLLYLLQSASGTVWTVEVQPAHEFDIEKDMLQSMHLEDMTLTDLYHDAENFKKRIIYGYDSLMTLTTEFDTGLKECLARPDKYQMVSTLEPVKSRIILIGRTEQFEKEIDVLAPIFVAYTWSGYLDSLLGETCLKLATVNRSRLPNAKEIQGMSVGELAVLRKDISTFIENQMLVRNILAKTEESFTKINDELRKIKDTFKTKSYRIGMLDAALRVNNENLTAVPNRVKLFRKEWNTLCNQVEKTQSWIEKEYNEKKSTVTNKKRQILRTTPFVATLSILLLIAGFQPPLAAWAMIFTAIAVIIQAFYAAIVFHGWRSFSKATKYPSQPFNAIHLALLASTEAVYDYVGTGDILVPPE
jgi:putative peptide zinc metalloprotease protein